MESTLQIIKELTRDEAVMWVVGGGGVVSENNSKGIKEPEVSGGYATIEADNWHFHVKLDDVSGIQFVEAESHGDLISFYVRFSNDKEEDSAPGLLPQPLPRRQLPTHRVPTREVSTLRRDARPLRRPRGNRLRKTRPPKRLNRAADRLPRQARPTG